MARGLDKVTHDKAPVSMDITFVREMPNGTGRYHTERYKWLFLSLKSVHQSQEHKCTLHLYRGRIWRLLINTKTYCVFIKG